MRSVLWLRLHSCFFRLRHGALRLRAAAMSIPRGPARPEDRPRLQAIARRVVGIAALRRWREGANAAYESSHVWDLARRGSDYRKSHFALGELVRAADVAARNRELEVRAESMHMAQSLRQLHQRCECDPMSGPQVISCDVEYFAECPFRFVSVQLQLHEERPFKLGVQ